MFLKNAAQIATAIDTIKLFSLASGSYLNINKCELLPLKSCNSPLIANIPVKDSVTYLGITINKNQDTGCSLNFNPLIDKVQKRFWSWLQRDLSLKGRILVSKAEGISRLIYASLPLAVSKEISVSIDKMLLVQRLSPQIKGNCALFERNMKLLPLLVHTMRFIFRCGGKSDLTSEARERSNPRWPPIIFKNA